MNKKEPQQSNHKADMAILGAMMIVLAISYAGCQARNRFKEARAAFPTECQEVVALALDNSLLTKETLEVLAQDAGDPIAWQLLDAVLTQRAKLVEARPSVRYFFKEDWDYDEANIGAPERRGVRSKTFIECLATLAPTLDAAQRLLKEYRSLDVYQLGDTYLGAAMSFADKPLRAEHIPGQECSYNAALATIHAIVTQLLEDQASRKQFERVWRDEAPARHYHAYLMWRGLGRPDGTSPLLTTEFNHLKHYLRDWRES